MGKFFKAAMALDLSNHADAMFRKVRSHLRKGEDIGGAAHKAGRVSSLQPGTFARLERAAAEISTPSAKIKHGYWIDKTTGHIIMLKRDVHTKRFYPATMLLDFKQMGKGDDLYNFNMGR